jgi:hypothetical protein
MRELQVVFTTSKKKFPIGSMSIKWWTKKKYSHVARGLNLYGDIQMYYQASEGKVNYENKKVFDKKHQIVVSYIIMVPDHVYREISRSCLEDSGMPYGTMQNIGIFLIDLSILKKNPWKKGRNCSELLYLNVFKPLFGDLGYNPDTIKPHHIEDIILDKFIKKDDKTYHLNPEKLSTTSRDLFLKE